MDARFSRILGHRQNSKIVVDTTYNHCMPASMCERIAGNSPIDDVHFLPSFHASCVPFFSILCLLRYIELERTNRCDKTLYILLYFKATEEYYARPVQNIACRSFLSENRGFVT